MGLAIVGGAVVFDDLEGSPRIGATRDSRKATRKGRVLWSAIDALIAECFPTPPTLPGVYPGVSHLYISDIQIRPHHSEPGPQMSCAGSVATYTGYAEVDLTYETLPYDPSDLLTRRYSITGEFMTLSANGLRWDDQAVGEHVQTEDVVAGKLIPMIDHSITFHHQPSVKLTTIRSVIGHLNNAAFEGATAESLLFVGAEVSFTFVSDGTQTWTHEYRFQERIVKQGADTFGWNHFWRPGTKKWQYLLDDDGNKVYPATDLSVLTV